MDESKHDERVARLADHLAVLKAKGEQVVAAVDLKAGEMDAHAESASASWMERLDAFAADMEQKATKWGDQLGADLEVIATRLDATEPSAGGPPAAEDEPVAESAATAEATSDNACEPTSLREDVAAAIAGIGGKLYDANFDPRVLRALDECKELCWELNNLRPSDRAGRATLAKRLFASTGEHVTITAPFWCDYGKNIRVGENFYCNHNTVILDGAPVTFGDNVFIAPNCVFSTAGHPVDAPRRNEGLEYALPITVGDDVWFGMGVLVCPGVTIGSNVVIGAGSVVTKDIPSGVVAVGNPCKPLREIGPEDAARYERF